MRKIKWIDISDVNTQQCLQIVNELLARHGIEESDVISVQRIWNENPVSIVTPGRSGDKAFVTLFIFYWAD